MKDDASAAVSDTVRADVGLDDITHWLMLRSPGGNVGHILMSSYSHWHTTACGTMTPNGQIVQDRPKRKCRKCMDRLPTLKRSQPNKERSGLSADANG